MLRAYTPSLFYLVKIIYFFVKGFFYFYNQIFKINLLKVACLPSYTPILIIGKYFLYPLLHIVKDHTICLYKGLIDIICCDFFGTNNRFSITYCLISYKFYTRLLIRSYLSFKDFLISIASLFISSNWAEREIYEFYGIYLILNKDLRHLLLDYGFKGYPLLKNFPISGYIEVLYNDSIKKLNYRDLELTQKYRQLYLKRFLF